MSLVCKVKPNTGQYSGWIGVVNGIVHETAAQGRVCSVSIAPPDDDSPLQEVYLEEKMLSFYKGPS